MAAKVLPLEVAAVIAHEGSANSEGFDMRRRRPGILFDDEAACSRGGLIAIVVAALLLFSATFALSRALSPLLFPRTYRALALQPGQRGYWDSCVTSSLHAVLCLSLAIAAIIEEPAFLTSDDLYLTSPCSCRVLAVFFAWVFFDLTCELLYWGDWPQDGYAFLVHHMSAAICWGLFLQGGYGHALGLIGAACEVTNPLMNLRFQMASMGWRHTRAYLLNGFAFVVLFLIVRVGFATVGGLCLFWRQRAMLVAMEPRWRALAMAGFFGIGLSLQAVWAVAICRGAARMACPFVLSAEGGDKGDGTRNGKGGGKDVK